MYMHLCIRNLYMSGGGAGVQSKVMSYFFKLEISKVIQLQEYHMYVELKS